MRHTELRSLESLYHSRNRPVSVHSIGYGHPASLSGKRGALQCCSLVQRGSCTTGGHLVTIPLALRVCCFPVGCGEGRYGQWVLGIRAVDNHRWIYTPSVSYRALTYLHSADFYAGKHAIIHTLTSDQASCSANNLKAQYGLESPSQTDLLHNNLPALCAFGRK